MYFILDGERGGLYSLDRLGTHEDAVTLPVLERDRNTGSQVAFPAGISIRDGL